MSKYQIRCSCTNCHRETTAQSIKSHYEKCSTFKNKCQRCGCGTNNPMFCSHSCKATHLNSRRPKKPKLPSKQETNKQLFLEGKIKERPALRKHLAMLRGYQCSCCGLSSWNNQNITLIVDHIDGNAGNNLPDNLQLLCPNCNSQTPTFGGRNKGQGRKSRGLPLN